MIKIAGSSGGRPVLILGLDEDARDRIMIGDSIPVEASDLGLPDLRIIIVDGREGQNLVPMIEACMDLAAPIIEG